ncbi:MAG: YtxH domain-containing protein [Bacteroidota bacterium]
MADENNDGLVKGLLIGFIAGSAIGAIVALLYAPKSGKEMRADIKVKANDLKDEVAEKLKAARSKAVDIINEGRRRSEQIITEAKERAGHILTDADKMLNDARERAGEEQGKIKTAFRAGVDAYKSEKDNS